LGPIDTPLSEFLLDSISELFGSTTTVNISSSDYQTLQKNSQEKFTIDRSFSPADFDKFELTLDWAGVTGAGSHLELRNLYSMVVKNLGLLSKNLKESQTELLDLKNGIKKYLEGLLGWSQVNNSEFKLYKNRIYNINFLLEEESFFFLGSSVQRLQSARECIVDFISKSHNGYFRNLTKKVLNVKYKENSFDDIKLDDQETMREYEVLDDFHRTYSESSKTLNLYLPVITTDASQPQKSVTLATRNSFYEKDHTRYNFLLNANANSKLGFLV
jgi:hypothetical protein